MAERRSSDRSDNVGSRYRDMLIADSIRQRTPQLPLVQCGSYLLQAQGMRHHVLALTNNTMQELRCACSGRHNKHPCQVRYNAENTFQVFYGAGAGVPYSQYASTVPSKTNDLWIQGATNWTQYVVSPVGTWLQLVAYTPVEGPAGFYEMTQTDTTSSKVQDLSVLPGYNTMNFNADQVGRHMLYFVVNNQPSNVVIVDVFAQGSSRINDACSCNILKGNASLKQKIWD